MRVEVAPEAGTQLAKLRRPIQTRVRNVIARLGQWPEVSGVKWLTGDWKGFARIRTGDYRVVFKLASDDVLEVVRIADRQDVYAD